MASKPRHVKYADLTEVHVKPSGYHLLIIPDPLEDGIEEEEDALKTEGGILIPRNTETERDRQREQAGQRYGTLVAVGERAWADYDRFATREGWHQWAKPGDRIAYARYSAKDVIDPVTNIQFAIINDRDLTAVIVQ